MPVLDYCRYCGEWLGTVPSHEIIQNEAGSFHMDCHDIWKEPHTQDLSTDWFD